MKNVFKSSVLIASLTMMLGVSGGVMACNSPDHPPTSPGCPDYQWPDTDPQPEPEPTPDTQPTNVTVNVTVENNVDAVVGDVSANSDATASSNSTSNATAGGTDNAGAGTGSVHGLIGSAVSGSRSGSSGRTSSRSNHSSPSSKRAGCEECAITVARSKRNEERSIGNSRAIAGNSERIGEVESGLAATAALSGINLTLKQDQSGIGAAVSEILGEEGVAIKFGHRFTDWEVSAGAMNSGSVSGGTLSATYRW